MPEVKRFGFVLLIVTAILTTFVPVTEAATFKIGDKVEVTASYLNVRSGAGTNYPVIDGFKNGEVTEVGGYYANWLIVVRPGFQDKTPKLYGYVYADYVEPVNPVNNRRYEEPLPNRGGSYSSEDLYWLARIVNAEARGEPFDGQVAVANVVLNRVSSGLFPNTVKGVIFERMGKIPQFSPVDDGSINKTPNNNGTQAAIRALEGYNVVPDALYFYNPAKTSPRNWIRSRAIVTTIGNHVFAK